MSEKIEWETESLKWIHQVREEMANEIRKQGLTLAEWIRSREKVDIELLCRRLGLKNYKVGRRI